MKKTIVYYYSKKGNNRFLAEKITDELKCEIEEICPRLNVFPLMLTGLTCGIRKLNNSRKTTTGSSFADRYLWEN